MARVLSTLLVLALLGGTAVAFAITEGFKLEKTPVAGTRVDGVFSPTCRNCETDSARIHFRLRKPERLTVWIERHGEKVRTLVPDKPYPRGAVDLSWDGVSDNGTLLPDGTYDPVVHLGRSHRTIVLPNPIRVDTKPPTILSASATPRILSPDGDGRSDRLTVRYRVDEPAHGVLYVEYKQRGYAKFARTVDQMDWFGKVDGRPLKPGRYLISIAARDVAGNLGKAKPIEVLAVRYVSLGRKRVLARPGKMFAIRVSTDAPTVSWLLNGRRGVAKRGTMQLRAPKQPGFYRLYVTANGHSAKAGIVVA